MARPPSATPEPRTSGRRGALIAGTLAIPYLPHVGVLGFVPLPGTLALALSLITAVYVLAAELTKKWFYRTAV